MTSVALNEPVRVYQIESGIQILHKSNYVYPDEDIIGEPVPKMSPMQMRRHRQMIKLRNCQRKIYVLLTHPKNIWKL